MMKYNPFRPNSMVGPGMFAGRGAELLALDQALFQTKNGNPWHFLIHGERGIGKSSLMLCVDATAKGEWEPIDDDDPPFNFITIAVSLEPHTSYTDLIHKIGAELRSKLEARDGIKATLKSAWDFVSKWEVFGVSYTTNEKIPQASELIESLGDTFVSTSAGLRGKIDGFVILIDEADKAAADAHLGEFIKIFTERLTRKGCNNVVLGVFGISDVIDSLRASHESSVRILNHMKMEPLLPEERLEVIRLGIAEANRVNTKSETTIDAKAADLIASLSEGYPHFIQQYAFSAFEADMDSNISRDDVLTGAYGENGALHQLGMRYFEDMYSEQINSDEYRKVLKTMAADSREYISRKEIKDASSLKDTTLTNALRALSDRNIILKHPEKPGLYKLPTGSFRVWILAKAKKEEESKLPFPYPSDDPA